jgi:C1A family cysteine protease
MKKSILVLGMCVMGVGSLFAQELRQTGLLISEEKLKSMNLVEKPLGFGANLPSSFTMEKYVTAIGDQGKTGTCTAWSTTFYATTMAYNVLAEKNGLPMKGYYHYDPYLTYENVKLKSDGCQTGTYIEDALVFLINSGAKRQEIDKMECNSTATWHNESMSLLDITNAYYLYNSDDSRNTKVEAVCQMLSENKPVIIGMELPRSFHNVGNDGIFNPANNEPVMPNSAHAMCVVGYDDNKMGGAFKVVNSWGNDWGDKGFFWVKYDDFVEYVYMSYYFEYEFKNLSSADNGCIYGDCQNDYGIMKIKGKKGAFGVFEGRFSGGKPTAGVYYNPSKKGGKGGTGWMKKTVKKGGYGSRLIYEGSDYSKPVGFVLN